jgi:hypothetical protein
VLPLVNGETLLGVLKVVIDPSEVSDLASQADRFVDVSLRRRDGRPLLSRGGETSIFGTDRPEAVRTLGRGTETMERLPAGVFNIRALRGPMGEHWIAVAKAQGPDGPRRSWLWLPLGLILNLAVVHLTAIGVARDRHDDGRTRSDAS